MRHKLAAAVLSGAIALGNNGVQAKTVKLVMWENATPEWMQATTQVLAEFQRQNPDIQVELQPRPDSVPNVLPVRMAGGEAPDVISFWGSSFKAMAMQGMFLDLAPYINKFMSKAELADFFPGQMQFFKIGGTQFALPQYAGTIITYYNRNLFQEAGLQPPASGWTVADLVQMGKKLTMDKTGDGKPDQYGLALLTGYDRISYWLRRWGGGFLRDNDPRQFGLDQPASLEALQALQAMIWVDQISPSPSAVSQFRMQSGKAGMEENGPWQLTQFSGLLKDVPFELGVAETPRGPAGQATMVSSDGYAVVSTTKHPDEAFRLVQFLASTYASRVRASVAGLQPSRRSAAQAWLEAMPKRFPVARGVDWTLFLRATEYAQPDPVFYRHNEVAPLVTKAVNDILGSNQPVRARIAEVAPAVRALLSQ